MKKKIRLAIFDLDGTVMNAYRAVCESTNYVLRTMKCAPASAYQIRRAVGWGEGYLLQTFMGTKNIRKAKALYRRHHTDALKKWTKPLPGAKRLLRYLKKNDYLVAAASNRATKFSHIALRIIQLDNYFDCIICRDKVARPKPHPDILHAILRELQCKPSQAIFVGDMSVDIQAGKRARMLTVAIPTGSSTRAEIKRMRPYKIVSKLTDVIGILKKLNNS